MGSEKQMLDMDLVGSHMDTRMSEDGESCFQTVSSALLWNEIRIPCFRMHRDQGSISGHRVPGQEGHAQSHENLCVSEPDNYNRQPLSGAMQKGWRIRKCVESTVFMFVLFRPTL